jgi:hypothetical protein
MIISSNIKLAISITVKNEKSADQDKPTGFDIIVEDIMKWFYFLNIIKYKAYAGDSFYPLS